MEELYSAFGRTWLDDRPMEFLTTVLEAGNRMGGQAGEDRVAQIVAEEFEQSAVGGVERVGAHGRGHPG